MNYEKLDTPQSTFVEELLTTDSLRTTHITSATTMISTLGPHPVRNTCNF